MTSIVLILWLAVGAVQLGLPLAYFAAMRRIERGRDYRLNTSTKRKPSVSVIIPTFNEASVIQTKLSNVADSDYPLDRIQLIVVDSGSTDRTAGLAREYILQHNINGTVIEEKERTGKSKALNLGLSRSEGEIVCISDAECTWDTYALRNAVKYFADPTVGSVSGVHNTPAPTGSLASDVEGSYRSVYRMVRVAESKLHSTPIGEGEIQLFRRKEFAGFDPSVGGDDTCAALCMVEKGFRAISAEDVVFYDPAPPAWKARFGQKIRRGQHVLQAFLKHRGLMRGSGAFARLIFPMEFFLYAVNPLIFPIFLVLTGIVIATTPLVAYLALASALIIFLIPSLRTTASTYISNNLTMLAAIIQETRGNKQLIWAKVEENRPNTHAAEPEPLATVELARSS